MVDSASANQPATETNDGQRRRGSREDATDAGSEGSRDGPHELQHELSLGDGNLMHLDRSSTAVLALHWLNDIVHPDGRFGATFHPMIEATGVVDRTRTVLDTARRAGMPVVYTRVCFRPGYPDLLVNNQLLDSVRATGALVDGEKGAEIIATMPPEPADIVVSHRRLTAFHGTELDTLLRLHDIDTLLLTGVATNITVEGTAREAINLGYRTVVISDCCAAAHHTAHDASLSTLALIATVATADEVLGALRRPGPATSTPAPRR